MNNTATSNGEHTLIVMEADSECLHAAINLNAVNHFLIGPADSCTETYWTSCETCKVVSV